MTLEQALISTLGDLPLEKKQAVLDFAQFLKSQARSQSPRRNIQGLCADLNVSLPPKEIEAARQDMWTTFPREDVP